MKRFALIAALLASAGAPALAADLPVKARPMPPPVEVLNWTGFYIGVNGGYSWGHIDRSFGFVNPVTGLPIVVPAGTGGTAGTSMDGGLFGGQIGYNWQSANWVFGLETDAQWTGQRGGATFLCPAVGVAGGACLPGVTAVPPGVAGSSATLDQRLEWFGTFRGRVGVLVTPSTLLYATGGAAYGTIKTDIALASLTAAGVPVFAAATSRDTRFGWTVGGGIEAKFSPAWSAKLEYLYMDLGTVSHTAAVATGPGIGLGVALDSHVRDHIFRAGINYHFNPGPGPVAARY